MPVKTKRDEEKWERAKEVAEESGQGGNYAYIMGIYKKMKPDYEFKTGPASKEASLSEQVLHVASQHPEHADALMGVLRDAAWVPGEMKDPWEPGVYSPEVPADHSLDDGSQVPPARTNDGEQIVAVPGKDGEFEAVDSVDRVANEVEDEWARLAARVQGASGRGFTHKAEMKFSPPVNDWWNEGTASYHPDGVVEVKLETRKRNVPFSFSTHTSRSHGPKDLDTILANIKRGKMPRGFKHQYGAKFVPGS